MPDRFPIFEVVLNKRGRKWRWRVCTTEGTVVMQGSESDRRAGKYQADRALFLLLLTAPYQSRLSAPVAQRGQALRAPPARRLGPVGRQPGGGFRPY